MQALLVLNLIVPIIMITVGAALKKHPVSDINSGNGYCTPASRKSEAHWEYAQQMAPERFILLGKWLSLAEIALSLILLIFHVYAPYSVMTGSCLGFLWLGYAFYDTDKRIKERFADRG